jgi:NADPH2:quinone reductase
MRAIVVSELGPPEGMAIEERPTPEPGPDQARVEVRAIGINHPDLLVLRGKDQTLPPRPFVPGKDAAGVVSTVGESVRHCLVGNRVLVQPGGRQARADDRSARLSEPALRSPGARLAALRQRRLGQ